MKTRHYSGTGVREGKTAGSPTVMHIKNICARATKGAQSSGQWRPPRVCHSDMRIVITPFRLTLLAAAIAAACSAHARQAPAALGKDEMKL
ncbi:hypothetical protein [Massilia putida]|uniref:hypothetical protein n=1 Tax=Massilia putida TaxID=1141883 RepID=UPI0012EC96B4|nr:hypothetical protein [Massilia putida]